VKGHIFVSFLALYLSATIRCRLQEMRQKEHLEEVSPLRGVAPARLPIPCERLLEDLPKIRVVTVRPDNR
jgi:hypothetical protein